MQPQALIRGPGNDDRKRRSKVAASMSLRTVRPDGPRERGDVVDSESVDVA